MITLEFRVAPLPISFNCNFIIYCGSNNIFVFYYAFFLYCIVAQAVSSFIHPHPPNDQRCVRTIASGTNSRQNGKMLGCFSTISIPSLGEMEQTVCMLERGTIITKYYPRRKPEQKTLMLRRETRQVNICF